MSSPSIETSVQGETDDKPELDEVSPVERAMLPYDRQIEEHGHILLHMTPEVGETWFDRFAAFATRLNKPVED